MKFLEIARLFSDLENTSKRLEMTEILSNFFQNIKDGGDFSDLNKVMYLLQGQLTPNMKQFPKMGIAEKMIIDALSIHSGVSKSKIVEIKNKKGDVGLAAEFILARKKKQKSLIDFESKGQQQGSLDISEVYSEFEKIALTHGPKSSDIKLGILRGLMNDPLETKYLIRIIMSTLRVGASTQTIIDGLALGFTGSKQNRDIIERAYNLHPDLGDIARILAERGINEIKNIQIEYGTPIRNMLASRVPYTEIPVKLGIPFIAEYKLDGERLQIHKMGERIMLFSRQLLEISDQYPDVCEMIKQNIIAKNVILEGEVVAMDAFYEQMLPFQVLSKRRRKYDVENISKEIPVCVFLFDLLKFESESYIDKPLPSRRKKLEEITKEREELKLVNSVQVKDVEELVSFFNEARKKGNEGVMTKSIKADSVYQPGNRGFLWIKLKGLEGGKLLDSVDLVIIGGFYGEGKRTGVFGTYLGAVYNPEKDDFEAFSRVGAGFSDDMLKLLSSETKKLKLEKKHKKVNCDDKPDVWFSPEIVIEIIGDEITLSNKFSSLGYSMRFPVFQRLRQDKGPTDITTIDEIENLYQNQ
ncbi:MAG: ATP-dependent DNA ligase [Candidatus Lokiarchaeota archaeon]|nr:ATP-dependent DNA ligase [Candidatus Lokiarchaeota archaeon]